MQISANSFSWRADPFHASLSSTSVAAVTSGIPGRKPVQRLHSDSGDSASNAEASDSDSDEAPFAKRKCPNRQPAVPASNLPPAAARPKTKYNIWGSVLQEQTLAKDLSGWFGMNSKVESDRDVETYDYRNAMKTSLANNSTDELADVDIADDSEEPQTCENDADICDRETFGTNAGDSIHNHSEDKRLTRKRKRDSDASGFNRQQLQTKPNEGRQSAKNRLGQRSYDKEKDRSHVRVGTNDSAAAVGEELVRILAEPDNMLGTFGA